MKPSELFSSMDEVREYLEQMKPFCTEDQYEALKFVLGMADQDGEFVEVEGIGQIDVAIANLVKKLNDKGYVTLASCSGIMSEHPNSKYDPHGYLSFLSDEAVNPMLVEIANRLQLPIEEGECYLKSSISIRVRGENDDEIRAKWKSLEMEFEHLERRNDQ